MAFLCIDIGGTNTLIGVGNGEFEIMKELRTNQFLEKIDVTLREVVEEAGYSSQEIEKVAVAVAGPLNREKGTFRPPNIEEIDEVQIVKPLERYGEVIFVNDCTSAVAGEYFYGEKDSENIVYLTISSGIGLGAVIDGNIVEGWNGNLGEVGHVVMGDEGVECGCGGLDHWEAYCSGNGMPQMAKKLFDAEFQDSLEIFQSYRLGERNARKTVEKMRELNARGFENIVDLFNPERVYVGGAVALNHFEEVVEKPAEMMESLNRSPSFLKPSLGKEVVIHGLKAACNGKFRPEPIES